MISRLSLSGSGHSIPGIVTRPFVPPGSPAESVRRMPSRVKGLAERGVRRETVVHKQLFFFFLQFFCYLQKLITPCLTIVQISH